MTTDAFDKILEIVSRAEHLGTRTLGSGARLVGHIPHVAPEAYLHVVFPPLDEAQIASVEDSVGRPLPDQLKAFYRRSNGIMLFAYEFTIYGLRHNYIRRGDAVWQPYSIVIPNVYERPRDADDSFVFFGGYRWDGSSFGMTPGSKTVYHCAPGTARPLNNWPSFSELLLSEASRLSELFDQNGRKIDPEKPTVPSA